MTKLSDRVAAPNASAGCLDLEPGWIGDGDGRVLAESFTPVSRPAADR